MTRAASVSVRRTRKSMMLAILLQCIPLVALGLWYGSVSVLWDDSFLGPRWIFAWSSLPSFLVWMFGWGIGYLYIRLARYPMAVVLGGGLVFVLLQNLPVMSLFTLPAVGFFVGTGLGVLLTAIDAARLVSIRNAYFYKRP